MHLLFDLDGTLVDSRPGIIASIRQALAANTLPVPEPEDLNWCIGPPILDSFRKLIGTGYPERFEATVQTYRSIYGAEGIYNCRIFPEVVETLEQLRAAGHTLHVATSKATFFARPIVDHFALAPYFTSVNGSELDGSRADKGELIAHILLEQRIPGAAAVMIGDREHDMTGAGKNAIPAIGALWGYGSGAELIGAGATLCARVPHLLPDLIDSLLAELPSTQPCATAGVAKNARSSD